MHTTSVHNPVDAAEPAQAAENTSDSEVDVDDAQLLVDDEEMDIVDPFNLGSERVHDLLVQEFVAEHDLVVGYFERFELVFGLRFEMDDGFVEGLDFLPVELERALGFSLFDS